MVEVVGVRFREAVISIILLLENLSIFIMRKYSLNLNSQNN